MTTMVSSIIFFFLSIIFSLTVDVNSQTCNVQTEFNTCSSNSACGCLPLSNSNTLGICGLRNASCSEFAPCQSPNDICLQPEHICIQPPRCGSPRICYPLSMADQILCPPSREMTSIMSPSMITSNYTGELTVNSQNYSRAGFAISRLYYYQAYEVRVATTGTYYFTTTSTISDTYGYLYQGNFYLSHPLYNLKTEDDDSAGNRQFKLTATLRSDITYILVFTTFDEGMTGSFHIVVSGPDDAFLKPLLINT